MLSKGEKLTIEKTNGNDVVILVIKDTFPGRSLDVAVGGCLMLKVPGTDI